MLELRVLLEELRVELLEELRVVLPEELELRELEPPSVRTGL